MRAIGDFIKTSVAEGRARLYSGPGRPTIPPMKNSFVTVIDALDEFDSDVPTQPDDDLDPGTWDEVEYGREVKQAAMDTLSENESWFQIDGETDRSYELFTAFLGLGMGRTKQEVADRFGVSGTYVRKVGSDFDWNKRARDYDQWRQRIWSATIAERTMEMAERHGDIAAKGIRTLALVFDAAEDKGQDMVAELSSLGAKELLRYVRDAARAIPALMNAERLSVGMPTEISQSRSVQSHEVTIQTTDELADLLGNLNEIIGHRIPEPIVVDVGGGEVETRALPGAED